MLIGIMGLCLFFVFYSLNKESGFKSSSSLKIEKNETNPKINHQLNFGIALIIISAFVFATSTWRFINGVEKVMVLGFVTMMFFGIGLLLNYVFKIHKTAHAMTFIGCLLFGITVLSAGNFDVFGTSFSLHGNFRGLFLALVFLCEACVFLVRRIVSKESGYFWILVSLLLMITSLTYQLTNSIIISSATLSLILMFITLFKNIIFRSTTEFNIINVTFVSLLSLFFIWCNVYLLINLGFKWESVSLLVLMLSLIINTTVGTVKMQEVNKVLSLVYSFILTLWFASFSGSIITASFTFATVGIVMYLVYYLIKDNSSRMTSLILSYLSGVLSILLFCFSRDYVLAAPITSFVFIILCIASTKKDNQLRICNTMMQPVFVILLACSVIIQPIILSNIRMLDIVFILNVTLLLSFVAAVILDNKVKNGYVIALMVGLLIQVLFSSLESFTYVIISICINLFLIIYSHFSKDDFLKKCSLPLAVLLLIITMIGLNNYFWIKLISLMIFLAMFFFTTVSQRRKYLYVSLMYFPIIMLFGKVLPISYSCIRDFQYLLIIPFFLTFTRLCAFYKKEQQACVFELILFSLFGLLLKNNLFDVLFLVSLFSITYVFNTKKLSSASTYLNFLLFFTPVIILKSDGGKYDGIFVLVITCLTVVNQIMRKIFEHDKNVSFEFVHAFFTFFLLVNLINTLPFNDYLLFIISLIFIVIIYFIYDNQKVKAVVLSFLTYPLIIIINAVNIGNVNSVLNLFVWMIPLVIGTRFVFKMDEGVTTAVESIVLSFMFLAFIFEINFLVAITLGVLSVISIIFGTLFSYKSLTYVGYVSLTLTMVVQTFHFWNIIPWWIYLLIAGIILVVIAAIREKKKR